MSTESTVKMYFSKIKYVCSSISILILIWLSCHLFIRSCGGPFPDRTRGPFAQYRYYKLSDLPDWENQIKPDPQTGKTRAEYLIEGATGMPPIKFGDPFLGTAAPSSATPSVSQ